MMPVLKIRQLAKQIRGVSYKPSDIVRKENGYPILRANNIQNNELTFDNLVYVKPCKVKQKQLLKKGDIIICASSGSKDLVGKAAVFETDGEYSFGAFCKCIRIKDDLTINKNYVGLYFSSNKYRESISASSYGATIKNIKAENIDELSINLPTISEQKRIVIELNGIQNALSNKRSQLQTLDELIKSHFIEMFGDPVENSLKWRKEPLSKIIINVNNGLTRRGHDANGNIVLRLVELQDGVIDYSNVNRIILSEKEKLKFELKNNDFLFARVNGNPQYVGRCAVFHSIDEKVYHNDHIIRVHFDESIINGTFAMVLLNSHYGKSQMRQFISTSAGQYTINQDGIRAIIAILPPLELQNKFAEFVQKVDKAKTIVKKQITDLQELLDSKMSEYFR
ncbi:restriction endonuclease subunit S [Pumilibacter muris]|uniref:restriction endonuclease subunit S n=1 Tax=Pumilibacter muris TaxID=2941510 RepID=UPI0020403CC2|nr:restriction endonuclease subunit S [Pumilibacter muris]